MTVNRVTPEMIENEIAHFRYFTAAEGSMGAAIHEGGERSLNASVAEYLMEPIPLHTLTFCVLVLKNGYTVTGQSSCVDPATFNPMTGREIALADAKEKVWPLLGFRLKDDAK